MEQKHEKGGFRYTYSAREQAELQRIREKYVSSERSEDKMARVRSLDRGATKRAQTVAIILGVLGALIMGMGMSLAMTELAASLGIAATLVMPIGIGVGLCGMLLCALAYPIYLLVLRRARARIAPEILQLTEELMK